MTIDEAIAHCLEVAEQLDEKAKTLTFPHLPTEMKECKECAADHRQLAEWLTELKEAKRLLKAAVEDFSNIDFHIFDCDGMCNTCPLSGERDYCLKWRYYDEALKLMGGEADEKP